MAVESANRLGQLPDEMLSFTILKASESQSVRLGRLALQGRKAIDTPHYIGITSRGVMPHLTQDNFAKHTSVGGIYIALEDFIEKAPHQVPPIYQFEPKHGSSPLRSFCSLPSDTLCVMGARRSPAIASPPANSNTRSAVIVLTSVGFKTLLVKDYVAAGYKLRPDILIGLHDIPQGHKQKSMKRIEKMTDRTANWTRELLSYRAQSNETSKPAPSLFVPILPVATELQSWYLDHVTDPASLSEISGLAIYDTTFVPSLPSSLTALPRLALTEPATPHDLLIEITQGVDLFTIPFIGNATDAGIALSFSFPDKDADSPNDGTKLPLGVDMWLPTHSTSLTPLTENCTCYTCTKHHRAFVSHLLSAKEMLGWVLLQIHNHHVMDKFFASVRASIRNGTFEQDRNTFASTYEVEFPTGTGKGPRVRGYAFKSEGPGEPKKNPSPWKMMDEGSEVVAEVLAPSLSADAEDLEGVGFAEKASANDQN